MEIGIVLITVRHSADVQKFYPLIHDVIERHVVARLSMDRRRRSFGVRAHSVLTPTKHRTYATIAEWNQGAFPEHMVGRLTTLA
jgi:hypothetical protein